MAALNGAPIDQVQWWLLAKFSVLLLLTIVWHFVNDRTKPGKAEALARLTAKYRWPFFGGVIGAGTVLPVLLAVLGAGAPSDRPALAFACLVLTVGGGFYLRLLTLRVGYFPPVSGALRLSKRPR